MIKQYFILVLSVLCLQGVYGQTVVATQEILQGFKGIPQEEIFVHHNTDLLLAGEYFYYKVFCKNEATQKLSALSKVAYVELVDSNSKMLFRHKIRLNEGTGHGDFFVPVGTPSGSYKLIAYTQWMRNGGIEHLYTDDIAIINPYQNSQENILASNENPGSPIVLLGEDIPNSGGVSSIGPSIKTDRDTYGKRERVRLQIAAGGDDFVAGTYSISVQKANMKAPFPQKTALNYQQKNSGNSIRLGNTIYLPELRGEVVWGTVTQKTNGSPVSKAKVALSIPGQDFVTKIANTNSEGAFYFVLQDEFGGENATFQVLGDQSSLYEIDVAQHIPLSYDGIQFQHFSINSELEDAILERSVYNQIENGYYELKPDTVKVPLASPPFYGERGTLYKLDDYKRFSTVKETFLEFIDDAWTKGEDGKTVFSVRPYENTLVSDFDPLIIVDGIILQDQQKLLEYPSRKIKSISIVRDKYYLGADVFQGVITVETLTGDFYESLNEGYVSKVNLFTAQPKKSYFQQRYDMGKAQRIPDFRSQLLWEPNAEIMEGERVWEFYTSDNAGIYEISLEGFTQSGKPVSLRKMFHVK
ncbi:MAG: hypothetical protein KTR22_01190 [Flavobacteriaceae bacterium]|nr:hypothetical protein [Flavobacteriaceae bacterium]